MSKIIALMATIIILILAATESRRHLAFAPIPVLCNSLCNFDLAVSNPHGSSFETS